MRIFEVVTVLNKKIRLTQKQWSHIADDHEEVEHQLKIVLETLEKPQLIFYDERENNFHYYRFYNETPVGEKFMLVVVKHLDGEGFVITALFTNKFKKVKNIWPR